eukprot:CAMPEP_0204865678 /NCGR_PEP_ID=MMETSP1348-20121228/12580_1 /ASSEMBLY_ACC=CAM_ASM_000700 /TAXON_ID=215587 /ORGANISM="Aplanochytrium stocchinoi, Strain GSBS06" /LENGTH=279 /DNA_ID=CAMNT_0052017125 /DNA_START=251 /DNA_END=1090 /DNA_ORIENTATION=-
MAPQPAAPVDAKMSFQPPHSPDGILDFPFDNDFGNSAQPSDDLEYSQIMGDEFFPDYGFNYQTLKTKHSFTLKSKNSFYQQPFGSCTDLIRCVEEEILNCRQKEAEAKAAQFTTGDLSFMFFDAPEHSPLVRKRSLASIMNKSQVVPSALITEEKPKKKKKKVTPKAKAEKTKKACEKKKSTKKVTKKSKKAKDGKKNTPKKSRSKTQSSKYRGVSRCSKDGRWQARIRIGSTVKYLGRFRTELEAAECYDVAAYQYHGARAMPNFTSAVDIPSLSILA